MLPGKNLCLRTAIGYQPWLHCVFSKTPLHGVTLAWKAPALFQVQPDRYSAQLFFSGAARLHS